MKLFFSGNYQYNHRILLQKCGYAEISNRQGQISYVRVFGRSGYPRFHCYVQRDEEGFRVNLHIDQKKPSYGSNTAHSGEYEGEIVEAEAFRIKKIINSLSR